ncbi:MAG: CHRD domain-containing protein [Candidatus Eiseniibacteriota bacterium]
MRQRPMVALRVSALLTALSIPAVPVAAETYFHAIVDGAHGRPPNPSPVLGIGSFVLNDDQTLLEYDIQFSPWIRDEIASHIHMEETPGAGGDAIVDLPFGPSKVGTASMDLGIWVEALFEGRLYVIVHSTVVQNGEVGGYIVAGVPTRNATWGRIKGLYR